MNDHHYVDLSQEDMQICLKFAKNASIGGKSHIHISSENRQKKLITDNLVGQLGTLGGSIFLYGYDEGKRLYIESRLNADKNPYKGDGGSDIINQNIDIKCSFMRRSKNPNTYNFLLRPREKHPNWTYIQTLLDYIKDENTRIARVYTVGYVTTDDLPDEVETRPPFDGAYKIPVPKLRKLHPIEIFKV